MPNPLNGIVDRDEAITYEAVSEVLSIATEFHNTMQIHMCTIGCEHPSLSLTERHPVLGIQKLDKHISLHLATRTVLAIPSYFPTLSPFSCPPSVLLPRLRPPSNPNHLAPQSTCTPRPSSLSLPWLPLPLRLPSYYEVAAHQPNLTTC